MDSKAIQCDAVNHCDGIEQGDSCPSVAVRGLAENAVAVAHNSLKPIFVRVSCDDDQNVCR